MSRGRAPENNVLTRADFEIIVEFHFCLFVPPPPAAPNNTTANHHVEKHDQQRIPCKPDGRCRLSVVRTMIAVLSAGAH